jgi:hypothetical protein
MNPNSLSEPTLEYQLLLLCARTSFSNTDLEQIALHTHNHIDWDEFILIARLHGLAPLVFRALSRSELTAVPQDALSRLKQLHEAFRVRNLLLRNELLELVDTLAKGGVQAVPYKGPVLAEAIYGDIALRQFVDLDLLIRPTDALRARRILLLNGYDPLEDITPRNEKLYAAFHCGFSFKSKLQSVIEINWRIAPRYWRFPEISETMWSRLEHLPIASKEVPWFTAEDLLLILCMHGCKHKWDQLKWIVDIAELLRSNHTLNWDQLQQEAQHKSILRILNMGLILAHTLLDAQLPQRILDVLNKDKKLLELTSIVRCSLFSDRATYKKPAGTLTELFFLVRCSQSIEMKLFCSSLIPSYFILHYLIRPIWSFINPRSRTTDQSLG